MKAVISSHNKNMLAQDHGATAAPVQQPRTCNCKNKPKCPLQGNCVKENVVYQATVATETTTETHVGLASNFKERYRNHQTSFRHRSKRNETELSKYIWDLKDRKKSFHVKWRILRSCQPYSNVSKECDLCLQEKYFIIRKDLSSLNKRNELASSCRHRNRLSLKFFRILFIAFDVVEFYPSISLELLSEALQFASEHDPITDNERHIILEAKSSLLYSYGEPWGKKTS